MINVFALSIILTVIISYLLGSLNSSIISVRILKHEDIRNVGSKSAGLTNTYRCFGAFPALCTLIGDLAKGVIAVLLSIFIFEKLAPGQFDRMSIGYVAGIFAIIGHIFPVYYRFKGGKGVLVSSSILLVIDPLTFVIIIPFFILMIALTRYVSVASITAAIVYPFLTFALHYFAEDVSLSLSLTHTALTACTSILLIYMHRANISRLKNHTENKFNLRKSNKNGNKKGNK
jgi:glycerol-3-phosphate acyltransferase PlsY